jgi:hypothetical protein
MSLEIMAPIGFLYSFAFYYFSYDWFTRLETLPNEKFHISKIVSEKDAKGEK